MGKNSPTGVVITQWRDPDTTALCLRHVAGLSRQPELIVVVDNESDSDVLASQKRTFPDVHFLGLPTNRGHAEAVNIGMRHVIEHGCEYGFLLDNDAYVAPESLERL
jgi:GT2 family glycosyltransferase